MRKLTAILLSLMALPATAQEGIYVGLGLGSFDYEETAGDPLFGRLSDTVSSYKIFGGFEINDYLAIEIDYGTSSEVESSFSGSDPNVGNFLTTVGAEFTTTTIKVVGQYPRDWGVLLGGIGYFDTDTDIDLQIITDLGGFSSSGTIGDDGMAAMLGIEWRFGRFGMGYGIRLEYEWRDMQDADASTIGLGVSYRF